MSATTNSTRGSRADRRKPLPPSAAAVADDGDNWGGAPLRSSLWLLMVPALFAFSIVVFKIHPGKIGLYGFAAIFGLLLLGQLRKGPEALLAIIIVYMPLSRMYVAKLAPGINGTNALELLLVAAWIISAYKNQKKLFSPLPFTRMMTIWLLLTLVSVFTAIAEIGFHPFIWNYAEALRGFLDQFIIFFLFVNLIRDKNMARRLIFYVMISAAIIYVFGIHEWWETRGANSIAKSRLLGPVGQPNDFAALMIYSLAPFLAYGAYYFPRWRSIRLAPVALIGLKVLLAAFSRGAYLAFAMELMTLSFVKSKKFFVLVLVVLATIYFFIPALVPNSMKARVAQTYQDHTVGSEIDKSADSRIILWQAAITMTEESPILGKGFDQFHSLVPTYVSGYYDGVTGGATDNQNMFLYTASNMGLPSLITLLAILFSVVFHGWRIYRKSTHDFDRIIGLGAVTMVAGLVGVNMFGTHVTDTAVDGFFWVYLAAMAHLMKNTTQQPMVSSHAKLPR
jgi:O-antigen ligase